MIAPFLRIFDRGDGTRQFVTTDGGPDHARIIGIQTRIGEHLLRQGATSDVVCTRKPVALCDYASLAHGNCTRPIGHPGAHVFGARKPEAKS